MDSAPLLSSDQDRYLLECVTCLSRRVTGCNSVVFVTQMRKTKYDLILSTWWSWNFVIGFIVPGLHFCDLMYSLHENPAAFHGLYNTCVTPQTLVFSATSCLYDNFNKYVWYFFFLLLFRLQTWKQSQKMVWQLLGRNEFFWTFGDGGVREAAFV